MSTRTIQHYKTRIAPTARERGDGQGMNWIRQEKRLAIYLRDGLACVWCSASVEDGVQLTLDHLKPHSKGGSNHEKNLVTACKRCNDSRGNRGAMDFAYAVAEYIDNGVKPEAIYAHVQVTSKRPLPRAEAKALMVARGSVFAVLNGWRKT